MSILRNELKIVSQSSRSFSILSSLPEIVNSTVSINHHKIIYIKTRDADVRVTKQFWVKYKSANLLAIVPTVRALFYFEPSTALVQCRLLSVNGIMEVVSNIAFRTLCEKFAINPSMHQKHDNGTVMQQLNDNWGPKSIALN